MTPSWGLTLLVLLAMAWSACSAAGRVETAVPAEPGAGVAVAFVDDVPLSSSTGHERDLVSCVATALRRDLAAVNVIAPDVLLRALFPLTTARANALDPLSLMLVRDDPAARRRLSAVAIRYVVALSGGSALIEASSGSLGVAMGGVWTRQARYAAEIYDVASGRMVGKAWAQAEAIGGVGIGIIPPFIYALPARPFSKACKQLGVTIVEALGGPPAAKK